MVILKYDPELTYPEGTLVVDNDGRYWVRNERYGWVAVGPPVMPSRRCRTW